MKLTLKAARVNRDLMQIDIANELGVHQETYSNWETGKKPTKKITRLAIAKVLEMDVDDIIWNDKEANKKPSPTSTERA